MNQTINMIFVCNMLEWNQDKFSFLSYFPNLDTLISQSYTKISHYNHHGKRNFGV